MVTTPLKISLAAACLVAVAIWIAVDQSTLHKDEALTAPPTAGAPQTAVAPLLGTPSPLPAAATASPTICPAVPAEEKKAAAPKVEEKPAAPVPAPAPAPAPKKILLETLAGGQRMYTVVQGDTLYGISVKVYNTPRHYERIYEANQDKIADPNTLQIGMKLLMPDQEAGWKSTNP